jgi:membrane associated rhomboid family serine protease
MLSPAAWIALAVMAAAVALAVSRRVLATATLVIGNLLVFLVTEFGPSGLPVLGAADPGSQIPQYSAVHAQLALYIPNLVHGTALGFLQLFTSMFVHDGLFHVAGNTIFLLAFGLPFEERVGHRKFLLLYALGHVVGVAFHVGMDLGSHGLLMGASAAIAGIMAAFAVRFPHQIVPVPVPLLFLTFFVRMRVVLGVMLFLVFQVFFIAYQEVTGLTDATSYAGHIGGLVGGAVFGMLLVKPARAAGPVAVDLQALAPFARDRATQQVLDHMQRNHDEPAVFQAWLDRFFRTASCPTCGHKVAPRARGEVVCTQNHRFDVRQPKAA